MLAYACQLGQKALKVCNYIIYFPVYLDTIYTLSLFLIPMQCSVFTSQKHPKHHFEHHKLHHGLSMSTAQLLQPTSTARRRLPKSPLDIWMLDRMLWSCVSWWVTGRSLVTGETEKKNADKNKCASLTSAPDELRALGSTCTRLFVSQDSDNDWDIIAVATLGNRTENENWKWNKELKTFEWVKWK